MSVAVKRELRRYFLKRREGLPEEERKRLSARIVERVLSLPQIGEAGSVLLFCPHRGEPDISSLFSWTLKEGKELLLPKVEGDGLRLIRVRGQGELSPGAYCILEPTGGEEVEPEGVDFSLVPGVLFDAEGYRIGYGKGYYDRLLKRLGGLKVGVCYQFQLVEEVPKDSWDVPVDLVVTEEKTYQGGKVRWA
ncbi:MAG: 5-formyltetrahydrofolate cyclo-ligase [Aquificaceae bacterium]|nr:5-formyltetrahydrofolate cyclo-ligase [Aquificaceae bacterium]